MRKVSHSYSGIWRKGSKRAPSLRETSKEEGQQQVDVFQLQGASVGDITPGIPKYPFIYY
jgi:hypothetical protein